jgi:MoxR-like ATPase
VPIPISKSETKRDCKHCPNFMTDLQYTQQSGKSVNAPVCRVYGTVLALAGERTNETIGEHYASNCPSFGDLNLRSWGEPYLQAVMLPDPKSWESGAANQIGKVASCLGCANYIQPDAVQSETGYTTGMCAAKGQLLIGNRLVDAARNCSYATPGRTRTTTEGMMYVPIYDPNFTPENKVVKQVQQQVLVDPTVYPTDEPVTAADDVMGVRAWRRVTDLEGSGNSVLLPIYKRDFFAGPDQTKIPNTGDDEHPELYLDYHNAVYKIAVLWRELDETPALWGQAGVGKTELFRHMAWLMQMPFERISITGSTEIEDLAGKMHFSQEKGTYFEYGRLPAAWMKPCVICIDEPNVGPPDVWQFIRPLTDNSKQMVLDQNKGERVSRNNDCYLGMAMNPAWDTKNVGTGTIADADGSRLMHIFMDLPPEDLERQIIRERCKLDGFEIPDKTLNQIMAIAGEVRALCEQDTLPITWGTRHQIKVARASRWFTLLTAYRMATADYLEPEAQAGLLDVVKAQVS